MNKSFEIILSNINKLTEENYIETLNDIINVKNQGEKDLLLVEFIKKVRLMMIHFEYDNESKLKKDIEDLREYIINQDFKLENILIENEFDLEKIKKERYKCNINYLEKENKLDNEKKEIKKITETIDKLQDKYIEMFTKEYLIEELENLAQQITSDLNSLLLDKTQKEILKNKLSNLTNDLTIITAENKFLTEEEIIKLTTKYNISLKKLLSKTDKKFEDRTLIEKEIKTLENTLEEINNKLQNNYHINCKNISLKESELYLKKLKEEQANILEHDNQILEWGKKDSEALDGDGLGSAYKLKENVDLIYSKIEILERKITTEKELSKRKTAQVELNKLKKLKYVKSTYNSIYEEAIREFENNKNPQKISSKVNDFINNHLRIKKLNEYENSEKIKKELYDDVINVVKPKKIEKTVKHPKLWKKALAGAAGFVAGVGVSCIPGSSIIRIVPFGLHLLHESAEIVASAFPESKITKLYDAAKERYQNSVVAKAYKTLREKPLVRIAVGGFAVGYIAGNIYELATGNTIAESIKSKFDLESNNIGNEIITGTPNQFEELPTPEESTPVIPEQTPIIEEIPSIEEIKNIKPIIPQTGEIFDLSALTEGYTRPDAPNMVNIMESLGKEVMFDKAVELPNGKVMWHFKRLNGAGYAWFDSEIVQELLSNSVDNISRVAR